MVVWNIILNTHTHTHTHTHTQSRRLILARNLLFSNQFAIPANSFFERICTPLRRLVACCVLLFTFLPCICAQGMHADSIRTNNNLLTDTPIVLYFRFDRAVVDSAYMDNLSNLRQLDSLLADLTFAARIDIIRIHPSTSPEGTAGYNRRLARRRALAMRDYLLRKHPRLDPRRIRLYPQTKQHIYIYKESERRYLRHAAVCIVRMKPDTVPPLVPAAPTAETQAAPPPVPLAVANIAPPATETTACERRPLFALKTNLLFDAALMPNVELEVPIGRRWSVNGEYMFPWWLLGDHKYCLQILSGGLEGRYWFGSRRERERHDVLTGHFAGLYAGGGKYDLQWRTNGYQGEFFIAAGVSYGYARRIARHLQLELSIGVGILRTDYRHYHAHDNYRTLLWQNNGKYTWLGPTKAKISLVWLLTRKIKAKKGGAL